MATQTESKPEVRQDVKAAKINVKLVLAFTESLFRHRKTLTEAAWEKTADSARKILRKTQREPETRLHLGTSPDVWKDFTSCFVLAFPYLEQKSFTPEIARDDPTGNQSALMTLDYASLIKDLDRMNDLLIIARNLLLGTAKAQNLAAEEGFDIQVLKYIDMCVRVNARGYDGDNRAEVQWANIVSAFKKLLVTCLQFLHNLVMHNESRKLLLWLDLFGSVKSTDPLLANARESQIHENSQTAVERQLIAGSSELAHRVRSGELSVEDLNQALNTVGGAGRSSGVFTPEEAAKFASEVMKTVDGFVNMTLGQNKDSAAPMHNEQIQTQIQGTRPEEANPVLQPLKQAWNWANITESIFYVDPRSTEIAEEDKEIARTPQAAAETLREAKQQLMARLQEAAGTSFDVPGDNGGSRLDPVDQQAEGEADTLEPGLAANGSIDGDDDDDDDYNRREGLERGLLTDIPLVLGPQDIEPLAMIIQSGIFTARQPQNEAEAKELQNMQAVRCNILLAQESGRNLLRELLIFIAAWDLQEDEFYFKLMMQIMQAILYHGLMPFAYQTFGELKDIVSPAQSIVIKILTQIFRKKQGPSSPGVNRKRDSPTRVDLLVVRYIFTIFRQSIIPETCALIYLQGQIRLGVALPEDFPLNLWDMERVYEGVYQFLEFFAVLTEGDFWKELLVKWEIVSELVTLLRELDASIPKAALGPTAQTVAEAEAAEVGKAPSEHGSPAPVAVERPYDPVAPDGDFDGDDAAPISAPGSPSQGLDNQEPSEFEWRNLKKLVVLVLSSLVWKSVVVQDQIRKYGGVEMVLSCCNYDANNPYIKEHAIMCLRFLLERNKENQDIVDQLQSRKVVPNEVLHKKGYETYIDQSGKVGLRKVEEVYNLEGSYAIEPSV